MIEYLIHIEVLFVLAGVLNSLIISSAVLWFFTRQSRFSPPLFLSGPKRAKRCAGRVCGMTVEMPATSRGHCEGGEADVSSMSSENMPAPFVPWCAKKTSQRRTLGSCPLAVPLARKRDEDRHPTEAGGRGADEICGALTMERLHLAPSSRICELLEEALHLTMSSRPSLDGSASVPRKTTESMYVTGVDRDRHRRVDDPGATSVVSTIFWIAPTFPLCNDVT